MSTETLDIPSDLYSLFSLPKTASPNEIKKAYRRLALQHHPDKHQDPEARNAATQKFQQLSFAYAILSDSKKRDRYDKTGEIDGLDSVCGDADWDAYFKEMWAGVVSAKSIEEFARKYRGSEEESNEVLAAYEVHKGDMDSILAEIPCSTVEDEERFRTIIENAINAKQVKRYKSFRVDTKAQKRRRDMAEKEAREAEKLAKEMGLDKKLKGEESLGQLIMQRQKERMSALIDGLEAKYGAKKESQGRKSKKDKKKESLEGGEEFVEPSEEEFQAIQAKLMKKKTATSKDNDKLAKEIKDRGAKRMSALVNGLEKKYGKQGKYKQKNKKENGNTNDEEQYSNNEEEEDKEEFEEPTEEEFQAVQAKLIAQKNAKLESKSKNITETVIDGTRKSKRRKK
ncbi:uncharacterized protein VTP21DRAFT_3539 [Calcarisporiella thermophila]|uniref:uncharacterized protein n=1 Tax=Calcarisporiella thermophila TaxID=911321 RepID=UPI0037437BC7